MYNITIHFECIILYICIIIHVWMYSISNTQEKAKEVVEAAIEAAKYVEELCTGVIVSAIYI